MGKPFRSRVTGMLWAACLAAVPANALAADEAEEEDDDSGEGATGLGPFELAPEPHGGNLGAPRSAVPETRLGVGLHWLMGGESTSGGDISRHALTLFAQGQLELFEVLEVGLEAELLRYSDVDYPEPSPTPDVTTSDFGFLVPRVKVAFLTGDVITLGAGLGVLLPTFRPREGFLPIGFDPGFYFQAQLFDLLSINFSLPFVLRFDIPDGEGKVLQNYYIDPAVGVAVMPIEYIGGFVDAQIAIWLNPEQGAGNFRLFNLLVGVRSNFLPWMMAELGAIVPVAGDLYDDELTEFGLGFRIAATPDLL